MPILYNFISVENLELDKKKYSLWIKNIITSFGMKLGDISFIFCNDEYILKINKEYLDHDYYTDVITFDYCENKTISGDIFISTETVLSNSITYNTNFQEELSRVIIHGVLHLLGIKDHSPAEDLIMREHENKALEQFILLS